MKIILPMAGAAPEFEKVFGTAKPFVSIGRITMLENACSMFTGKPDLVLIYRTNDLDRSDLRSSLFNISHRTAQLVAVDRPTKNVLETIIMADGSIDDDEEILVVHYDSYSRFDYSDLLNCIKSEGADGALTAFTGFSPYDKKTSNFGRIGVSGKHVAEIYEKMPLLADQLTAAGCYYFSSWKLFKKYAQNLIEQNSCRPGTVFVSEVYNEMLKDDRKVIYYIVDSFINFGSPKDVKEFIYWSEIFSKFKHVGMKGEMHEKHDASRSS